MGAAFVNASPPAAGSAFVELPDAGGGRHYRGGLDDPARVLRASRRRSIAASERGRRLTSRDPRETVTTRRAICGPIGRAVRRARRPRSSGTAKVVGRDERVLIACHNNEGESGPASESAFPTNRTSTRGAWSCARDLAKGASARRRADCSSSANHELILFRGDIRRLRELSSRRRTESRGRIADRFLELSEGDPPSPPGQ